MPGIMSEGSGSSPSPRCAAPTVMPMRAPRCLGSAAMVSSVSAAGREQEVVDHGLVLVGDGGDRRPAA